MSNALLLYTLLFEYGFFSKAILDLDDLYIKVLRHTHGHRASEVHPFILKEPNPLYILIQINVILLGSPIIGVELIGRVRYLQKMRAICAIVAFERLGRALDRTTLAASSPNRQSTLIVQAALLLDQVVEMRGDIPAAAIACARGKVHGEMRQHLIQYLSYYIHKLTSGILDSKSPLFDCINKAKRRGHLGEVFWDTLSDLVPCIPLRKPPMLRKYADMGWDNCGVEDGEALHELFSLQCSIRCN